MQRKAATTTTTVENFSAHTRFDSTKPPHTYRKEIPEQRCFSLAEQHCSDKVLLLYVWMIKWDYLSLNSLQHVPSLNVIFFYSNFTLSIACLSITLASRLYTDMSQRNASRQRVVKLKLLFFKVCHHPGRSFIY